MDFVYLGTPEFSRRVLARLERRHRPVLVVTQPDRPAGRGRRASAPPVKEHSQAAGIPVLQPERLRDEGFLEQVRRSGAAVGVVVAYGAYLPPPLLEALPLGFVNLHPSLLPRYRGAAPVNRAIMAGDEITGVTVIRVTGKMDAGPILAQRATVVEPEETAGELLLRLAEPGAELLAGVLDGLSTVGVGEVLQDDALATLAPKLDKEEGRIRWKAPAAEIVNLVRGTDPWPGAFTFHRRTLVKVLRARVSGASGGPPGRILSADAISGLTVAAGSGSVELLRLQKEGGQALAAGEFLRGGRWRAGDLLTDQPAESPPT
jgi:methionyl-tRNA formyltransferase